MSIGKGIAIAGIFLAVGIIGWQNPFWGLVGLCFGLCFIESWTET